MVSASDSRDPSPGTGDVVLGGQGQLNTPPGGIVLGGLDGLRQRLSSPHLEQRVMALSEALRYEQVGLEFVMAALEDESERVQHQAYVLLRGLLQRHSDPVVQQAVQRYAIANVRKKLADPDEEIRAQTLAEAIAQGHEGLNLVIRSLRDPSEQVQQVAYELLRSRPEPRVRKALEIFSSTGINYARLRALLINKKWQLADQETLRLIKKACGLLPNAKLRAEHLENWPCDDVALVDRLWIKHSQGRFGFSIQRTIWQTYYDRLWNKSDMWAAFGDRVGWRINHVLNPNHWKSYKELTFSLRAPKGHLPHLGDSFGIFTLEAIAQRIEQCQTQAKRG